MYAVIDDPYCYPGSVVLRNHLEIRDADTLGAFEAEMSMLRASEPLPAGRFSVSHFRAVHRHLFQDVYPWAGRLRTVRIAKDESVFCFPENIASQLRDLFQWLKDRRFLTDLEADDFARDGAHFLAELNAIHAFREGNGRAQMAFMGMLADYAGHPINFDALEAEPFLRAMISSFNGDVELLSQQLLKMITTD